MSMDVNKLLNGTLAGQMAQSLDKKDGEANGKINKSIWNEFIKEIRSETGDDTLGNEIKNFITVENAMNAITRYAIKAVNKLKGNKAQNKDVDEKAQVWAGLIDDIKAGDAKEEEVNDEKIDSGIKIEDEVPTEEETDPVKQLNEENHNNILKGQGLAGKFRYDSPEVIKDSLKDATPEELAYALRDYPDALKDLYKKGVLSQDEVLDVALKLGVDGKKLMIKSGRKSFFKDSFWRQIDSKAKEIRESVDAKRGELEADKNAAATAKEETMVANKKARAGVDLLERAATQPKVNAQPGYAGTKKSVVLPEYGKVDIYYNDDGSLHKADLFDKDGGKLMSINKDKVQVPNNQGQDNEYNNIDLDKILEFIENNF